ncbi:chorismate-binding protein [bacterium]|nr:chorismate-binding protein [bacterium]
MHVTPSREEFLRLAAIHPMVPVATEVLGDRDTAVSVFERLAGTEPAFLLESVEGGDRWARWSFAGWDPLFVLVSRDGATESIGLEIELPDADPLTVLESVQTRFRTPDLEGMPPLHSGLVGYLSYDAVRYIEYLPGRPPDDRGLPEMLWMAVGSLAAIDRFSQTVTLVRNVMIGDDPGPGYDAAVATLHDDIARLSTGTIGAARARPEFTTRPDAVASMTQDEYEAAVRSAVGHIEAGDAFQVVPSVRLAVPFDGDTFSVYRALRLINPSPFMFYLRHPEIQVAGSSPELMSRVRNGRVFSRPIAGTRPRGANPIEDQERGDELLADPKERAEHVMLVDLARNDLGRVCEFGSVSVDDLMVIERYSHVMHLVSGVSGTLREGLGPVDVLRATFPHGTVSGAPKVRAMEIVDTLEPVARGPYAGAVGYLDFSGNLDTAIALRTMVAAGGTAWVQAGAGVVADSDPTAEYLECLAKAEAVLAAIGAADDV